MGEPIKMRAGKLPRLSYSSDRRYGIELEINSFDGKSRPDNNQKPQGIDFVGMLVARNCAEGVDIRDWEHTSGNEVWVIKPDSSCGMEVCTPIFKGWHGLKKVCEVVEAFGKESKIKVDNRCSVHVHVEVADLSSDALASVIAHWFKVEPIFLDSVPPHRKVNRYCQNMGMNNLVQTDLKISSADLIAKVGNVKYHSLNTHQMQRNRRKTIEFRIVEGAGCKDAYLIKNWIRLLVQFVEMASRRPYPAAFNKDDPWSSFCWLDPKDAFKLLGFDPDEYELSPGLTQTRNWFLARLQKYMERDGYRQHAWEELQRMLAEYREMGVDINPEEHLTPSDLKTALYHDELKV